MANTITKHEALWGSTEVAEYLRVPIGTLNQWAYRSIGPAFLKIGKHRRYEPQTVEAWARSQRRGGDDAA